MKTVKVLKAVRGYQTGQIIQVSNNEAHSLIENGFVRLYRSPENRIMRPENKKRKKRYKVK